MMKAKVIVGICLIFLGFLGCYKENVSNYKSNGIIIGPDPRMCACCGGWYIQIDTITYEFDALPDNSDINLQVVSFPIPVKLDWELATEAACPDTRITILRIKKE
jgi:hypothetical protein